MSAKIAIATPVTQTALLLHAPKQRYQVATIPLPKLEKDDECLIQIDAIGLNPVDWKSADFGWGLPTLPCIAGRDLSGRVIRVGSGVRRLKVGDVVWGPSTAYRDYRTSAFQEFAVTSESCLGLVPQGTTVEQCAALGVGAVTAALAIGSALNISIKGFAPRTLAVGAEGESPPPDFGPEDAEGKWILIWGGSSTTGYLASQFAKLGGLKVVAVADVAKYGQRLKEVGVDVVVDRKDPVAAVEEVRKLTEGKLKYAVDCIGKETATLALSALDPEQDSILVGLSGLPKIATPGKIQLLEVPVKTFHTNPAVGAALMKLIEELMASGELVLPDIEVIDGGLHQVNDALDRLRKGDVGFGRLVIRAEKRLPN
ncbi:oxidoreductase [Pseudohyphozyma bogoriensis]|nr:oxidoreductase [Pseudohyphozyma bogoriensis]